MFHASFHNNIDISVTIAPKLIKVKTSDFKPNKEYHEMSKIIWN
jgi:hypothetical protein